MRAIIGIIGLLFSIGAQAGVESILPFEKVECDSSYIQKQSGRGEKAHIEIHQSPLEVKLEIEGPNPKKQNFGKNKINQISMPESIYDCREEVSIIQTSSRFGYTCDSRSNPKSLVTNPSPFRSVLAFTNLGAATFEGFYFHGNILYLWNCKNLR